MRRMLSVIAASLAAAGAASAQPYGYSPSPGRYAYQYEPPRAYDAYGRYTPNTWYNGYGAHGEGGYDASYPAGPNAYAGSFRLPSDRYGPDPSGMTAPDGHRIKCKLRTYWDDYYRREFARRECW